MTCGHRFARRDGSPRSPRRPAADRVGGSDADAAPRRRPRGAGPSPRACSRAHPRSVERARARAELLLERHGIVTRGAVLAEGVPGGFSGVYRELADLETLGACRRGYFVEGLGGAQFALPGAVERLRDLREAGARDDRPSAALVLGAADPAQVYGAAVPWPPSGAGRTPPRVFGAHVVLSDGDATLYLERGGRRLITLGAPSPARLRAALGAVADWVLADRSRRLLIERVDGVPVRESALSELLVEAGFRDDLRGMLLRAA